MGDKNTNKPIPAKKMAEISEKAKKAIFKEHLEETKERIWAHIHDTANKGNTCTREINLVYGRDTEEQDEMIKMLKEEFTDRGYNVITRHKSLFLVGICVEFRQ